MSSIRKDISVHNVLFFKADHKNWCLTHAYLAFIADNIQDITGEHAIENIQAFFLNVAQGYQSDHKGGLVKISIFTDCWYCDEYGKDVI